MFKKIFTLLAGLWSNAGFPRSTFTPKSTASINKYNIPELNPKRGAEIAKWNQEIAAAKAALGKARGDTFQAYKTHTRKERMHWKGGRKALKVLWLQRNGTPPF